MPWDFKGIGARDVLPLVYLSNEPNWSPHSNTEPSTNKNSNPLRNENVKSCLHTFPWIQCPLPIAGWPSCWAHAVINLPEPNDPPPRASSLDDWLYLEAYPVRDYSASPLTPPPPHDRSHLHAHVSPRRPYAPRWMGGKSGDQGWDRFIAAHLEGKGRWGEKGSKVERKGD